MLRMTNTLANTVVTTYSYNMFNLSCLEPMGNFYHTWKSSDKTMGYNHIIMFNGV